MEVTANTLLQPTLPSAARLSGKSLCCPLLGARDLRSGWSPRQGIVSLPGPGWQVGQDRGLRRESTLRFMVGRWGVTTKLAVRTDMHSLVALFSCFVCSSTADPNAVLDNFSNLCYNCGTLQTF